MEDKVTQVRNHVLDLLEQGKLNGGDKLPGARDIALEVGISLLTVQSALSSLVRDGILDSAFRRGTFVNSKWQERILESNLVTFNPTLPWMNGLRQVLSRQGSALRVCERFNQGVFEIRTTITVQENRNDYMDLSELFAEVYPDDSLFFSGPFRSFRTVDGKLIGIPFIFSPRVIFFNPVLLAQAGCPLPASGWTWDEFVACLTRLKTILPGERIFNWETSPFAWMNFVFRAGGKLIDPGAADPVKIDDPMTRQGLRMYRELKTVLGIGDDHFCNDYREQFVLGNRALLLAPREELCRIKHAGFHDWDTVPLPLVPGGEELTAQATDLLCIRKNGTDFEAAREFIRLMLSEEVQDFIGGECYGIPIRKSSALKSIDFEDRRDALFMTEMGKMSAEYNLSSPDLTRMIESGIRRIWNNGDGVEEITRELADAVRVFIKFRPGAENDMKSVMSVNF